jgi:hypothetical protein
MLSIKIIIVISCLDIVCIIYVLYNLISAVARKNNVIENVL